MKRKIAVISTTRADYGHLFPLLKEIAGDQELILQLVVGGMHLLESYGLTVQQIEADGFTISGRVPLPLHDDTPLGIARSIAAATVGFAETLEKLSPDIVLILGDRFEILAAAQACLVLNLPVAHIHGGESTEGAMDEAVRHSVTKMAHLHFVAAQAYRRRVIQLGESPERVFNFGAPGLDYVLKAKLLSEEALAADLNFTFRRPTFLVTYHPATLSEHSGVGALLESLDEYPDAGVIITKPNSDTHRNQIVSALENYAAKNSGRVMLTAALGQLRYLSALNLADVVIGNSSSGIIEAPLLKKASINLGGRQKGRLRASSIIDCGETREEITAAIATALSVKFQSQLGGTKSEYGAGNASRSIKETLKRTPLAGVIQKQFFSMRDWKLN